MNDDFLTVADVAARLQVSRQTIWRWIRAGKLETYSSMRDQRERLIRVADVEALIAPRKTKHDDPSEIMSAEKE